MRQLRIFEHISLDGVIQHSDDGDGFPYPDWTAPYRSPEGLAALTARQGARFDLLLGRRTYDLWSAFWPDAPTGPIADSLNAATKYVVTHRPDTLSWGPAEGIGGDLAAGIARIKARQGPDLLLWGSSTLTAPLLAHGLVDEVVLVVYPVTLGTGKRFFAGAAQACRLAPVEAHPLPSGVSINRYRVAPMS